MTKVAEIFDSMAYGPAPESAEFAKAWIAQAEAGEEGAADKARAALARTERHYLSHPVAGGWYDQFDADGVSLVDFIPASSFYHVLCAVAEAVKLFETG